MSNGGMDEFDWLQSFLPADSLTDPNINNEAYQTHQVFHDAEEAAKAAFMQEQAQMSYSFMRSANSGTNHALIIRCTRMPRVQSPEEKHTSKTAIFNSTILLLATPQTQQVVPTIQITDQIPPLRPNSSTWLLRHIRVHMAMFKLAWVPLAPHRGLPALCQTPRPIRAPIGSTKLQDRQSLHRE